MLCFRGRFFRGNNLLVKETNAFGLAAANPMKPFWGFWMNYGYVLANASYLTTNVGYRATNNGYRRMPRYLDWFPGYPVWMPGYSPRFPGYPPQIPGYPPAALPTRQSTQHKNAPETHIQ